MMPSPVVAPPACVDSVSSKQRTPAFKNSSRSALLATASAVSCYAISAAS